MGEINALAIKIPAYPPQSDFPADVLKWMKQNVVLFPRLAVKLMQTNEYFLRPHFPYICIKSILCPLDDDDGDDEWYIRNLDGSWQTDISFNDIPDNIWLTESLNMDKPTLIPQLLPKIVVYDIQELALMSRSFVTCSINHFKTFTSGGNVERLYLHQILFVDDNGENVPYDIVLGYVPNLLFFNLKFIDLQLSTSKIIDKLVTSKIQRLIITDIPDSCNFEALLDSLKKKPDLYVRLCFEYAISPEYCGKLQAYADKIVENGLTQYFPPRLDFVGITAESSEALKKLRQAYKNHLHQNLHFVN